MQLEISAPVDGSVFVMGTITELVAEIVVTNLAVASNIILMCVPDGASRSAAR
jgi:hypothetical protein